MKLNLVVLSGAGISAESGLATFRDSGGLWEGYNIEDVATPQAWYKNQALVLDFYNQRRRNVSDSKPNQAHLIIAELEKWCDVKIVTQNIDNLHEQAGSTSIIHLHGEITKACSSATKGEVIDIGFNDIELGHKSKDGSQLRPFIVWFGEDVPKMEEAIATVEQADLLLVIGTSLEVYPAAGLVNFAPSKCEILVVDPQDLKHKIRIDRKVDFIREKAGEGMVEVKNRIRKKANV